MTVTTDTVLDQLRQIIDPDLNRDIVSLGFVKNLAISGSMVSFDIELTTPACPVKAEFQKDAEALVKKIPGVSSVTVRMTSQSRKPAAKQQAESPLTRVRSIIAVSSCKGGVGKSTVAAYMALELARRGFKVGLMDADIHGPSIPTLLDLQGRQVAVDDNQNLVPLDKNNLKVMSFGFLLGDAPAVMRGPMVTNYIQQILHRTAWGELDYLFIDMPPGTGDVQLTITQTLRLSGAVIVTTPQTLSLVDVSRGILMFEKVDVPILGIIENMAYFICDKCQAKHYIFGREQGGGLSDRFGIETLVQIPLLPEFTLKVGQTPANEHITAAVDRCIRSLGKTIAGQKQDPEINFNAQNIHLSWPDGETLSVSNRELRLSCRCALCVNELTGEKILRPESVRADIAPTKIVPLGNYALGIDWNDNHTSGIYPYKTLRQIAAVTPK